jgi:hypothetical protein
VTRHLQQRRRHALREVVIIDGYPDLYFPAGERDRLGKSYYR